MLLTHSVSRENSTLTSSGSPPSSGGIVVHIPPGFVSSAPSDASTVGDRSSGGDLLSDTSGESLPPSLPGNSEALSAVDEARPKFVLTLHIGGDMPTQLEEPQEALQKGCWDRFWSWLCPQP